MAFKIIIPLVTVAFLMVVALSTEISAEPNRRSKELDSIRVKFLFLQVYDEERNFLTDNFPAPIFMPRVRLEVRDRSSNQVVFKGRTNLRGRIRIRLTPGSYSIGLARTYYSDQFCIVDAPACLGYIVELRNRSYSKNFSIPSREGRMSLKYREEFRV